MAAVVSTQLLRCSDDEFNNAVQEMPPKTLMEAVTVLQREMAREQENFNALSAELNLLRDKKSRQYTDISQELMASQTRLTMLMNRSMTCFSKQSTSQTTQKKTAQSNGPATTNMVKTKSSSSINSTPEVIQKRQNFMAKLPQTNSTSAISSLADETKPRANSANSAIIKTPTGSTIIKSQQKLNVPKTQTILSQVDTKPRSNSDGYMIFNKSTGTTVIKSQWNTNSNKTENVQTTKIPAKSSSNTEINKVMGATVIKTQPKVNSVKTDPVLSVSQANASSEPVPNNEVPSENGEYRMPKVSDIAKQFNPTGTGNKSRTTHILMMSSNPAAQEQVMSSDNVPDPVDNTMINNEDINDDIIEKSIGNKSIRMEVNKPKEVVTTKLNLKPVSEKQPEVEKQQNLTRGLAPQSGNRKLVNDEGEELGADGTEIVKSRVHLTSWDPAKLLKELYSVRLAEETAEDLSHHFISMEGYMEKLPLNKKKATLLKTWKRRFFQAKNGWVHYYERSRNDKPSESFELMGGQVEGMGQRVIGVDDGRGHYLMVRCPTVEEYEQWMTALTSQTTDNTRAAYVRPTLNPSPHANKTVVIVDIGTSAIRAGLLGDKPSLPQVFLPSLVGVDKSTGQLYIGADAYKPEARQNATLSHPFSASHSTDKFTINREVTTALFEKIFRDLGVNPSHCLVMLSMPQNYGDKVRSDLMDLLIDGLRTRGTCMVQQSLLALYSYNATSGIIVDIGERLQILPIYDGYVIDGGVTQLSYGGGKVSDTLRAALTQYRLYTPVEQLLVRYVKEQTCFVVKDYKESAKRCEQDPESFRSTVYINNFDLPEGTPMSVSHDYSCFHSPEGLFDADMWGMDYKSLHKLVHKAIQACPMDSRRHMCRSIYLSGGATCLPGFADRLQHEITKLVPASLVVVVHASPHRYHAAFIGASTLAALDVFEQSCILREEWKTQGAKAFRKWKTTSC